METIALTLTPRSGRYTHGELDLHGTTIGAIVRSAEGDDVLMGHNDVVIESDHVILFMVDKKSIKAVELFEVDPTFI